MNDIIIDLPSSKTHKLHYRNNFVLNVNGNDPSNIEGDHVSNN